MRGGFLAAVLTHPSGTNARVTNIRRVARSPNALVSRFEVAQTQGMGVITRQQWTPSACGCLPRMTSRASRCVSTFVNYNQWHRSNTTAKARVVGRGSRFLTQFRELSSTTSAPASSITLSAAPWARPLPLSSTYRPSSMLLALGPTKSLTPTRTFRSSVSLLAVSGHSRQRQLYEHRRSRDPQVGLATPVPADAKPPRSRSPFYFEAGYAGWAKRPSRAFPPPFFSPPSGSFSDPLSTHNRAADRRPKVNGQMIRGVTNGDDAMLVSDNLIGTNDGVGAWATKDRGHAPLWSRLMVHFLAMAAEENEYGGASSAPDPVKYLDEAYTRTQEALSAPNEWLGTTTSCSALLHFADDGTSRPVLYVTQLGDCKCLVIRPRDRSVVFATEEQWHYFDCPRQLGTNSPDTPGVNAVLNKIDLEEDDMVLAMSDGVTDNLWEGEITDTVVDALEAWKANDRKTNAAAPGPGGETFAEGMRFVAQELVLAARKIAEDPFAASPYMERAVDEGLAIEGGKLDDISVVAALCKKRKG